MNSPVFEIKAGAEFESPRGSTMKVLDIYVSSATNVETGETQTWAYATIEYNGEVQNDIPIENVVMFAKNCQ